MSTYTVKHLHNSDTFTRPSILLNDHDKHQVTQWQQHRDVNIEKFHQTLPHYGETSLHSLPAIAAQLGFRNVFIKDESTRFGLPSFKILGASWAIHRAICRHLGLSTSLSLDDIAKELKGRDDVRIVTCTEGNWGRACARMAKYLSIPATIYVPGFMNEYTRNLIRSEGADLQVLEDGSYDDTIAAVRKDAETTGALMTMDTSWEGYTEIPQWVTDGYSTMLHETDRQIAAQTSSSDTRAPTSTLAFVSVGVGSWAHAVVSHYKSINAKNQIIAVEPTAAPCLKESLHCGGLTAIETGETIMNGMNCGTPSLIAWPVLRDGVDAVVTVGDVEAHEEVQYLQSQEVNAGPCGAATLAALKKYCADIHSAERADQVVVLFSTEGRREYEIPHQ